MNQRLRQWWQLAAVVSLIQVVPEMKQVSKLIVGDSHIPLIRGAKNRRNSWGDEMICGKGELFGMFGTSDA